jgi:Indolepyruvate ferredoxin oxidoreductase, alpha and beta subunits
MADIVTGVEAVRLAAEDASVKIATGVPGFPINSLFTTFQEAGIAGRWQLNEKIAFEMAMGTSATGGRALIVSKHVGLNVMADPLTIASTHGIGSGIVVIAGDDPGATLSQDEQDSRWYGKPGDLPVYDPSTVTELYESIVDGLLLSEQISAPAIVRVTDQVLSSSGPVTRRKAPTPDKELSRDIWQYTMLGRHQKYMRDGWAAAARRASATSMNRIVRRGKIGIISSGYASVLAEGIAAANRLSHFSMAMVNPFPAKKAADFIAEMDAVLICEETSTFIESQVSSPKVRGRLTGHLPLAGGLDEQLILDAVSRIGEMKVTTTVEPETMQSRGFARSLCEGCPFMTIYESIRSLGVKTASDSGCSIRTANPPFGMVDVACSLGSPVSVASGFREKGVAMLGDFGLLHTGLPALLNAKYGGHDLLAIVFVNGKAMMTGGQDVPDVIPLLTSVFGEDCTVLDAGNLTAEQVQAELQKLFQAKGLKICAVRGECP